MGHQPIENLLPQAGGSIYRLVRMAATRAIELANGKRCLLEHPDSDKETTRALDEISRRKVVCKEASDLLIKAEEKLQN